MPLAVAKRYAQALGEVVTKPDSKVDPETILEQLRDFQALIEGQPELRSVLTSPVVPPVKKRAIVQRLGEKLGFSDPLRNFLYVVLDHRRLSLLGELSAAYRAWLDERIGIARIEVFSALPMTAEQRDQLVQRFRQITGREVRAEFREDARVLGGVVVQFGSQVYDGSLRAQLQALSKTISQRA